MLFHRLDTEVIFDERQQEASRIRQNRINAHLERVNLFAAGIDIGSQSHYVAIPEELDSVNRYRNFLVLQAT